MVIFYNHSIKILLAEQSSKPSVTWEGMADAEGNTERLVSKSKTRPDQKEKKQNKKLLSGKWMFSLWQTH